MPRVLRQLIPKRAFGPKFLAVVDAIALSVQAAFDAVRNIVREANAGTAVDSLPKWYEQLGLKYDSTLPVESLQNEARQRVIGMGRQTTEVIQSTLRIAFPFLDVDAHSEDLLPTQYRVSGEITDEGQVPKFQGLMRRIGPAEMEPLFDPIVIIKSLADTDGVLVLDTTGSEMIGRTYVEEN
jgi:hypothetical protein